MGGKNHANLTQVRLAAGTLCEIHISEYSSLEAVLSFYLKLFFIYFKYSFIYFGGMVIASLHIGMAISLREIETVSKALLSPVKVTIVAYEHIVFHFTLLKRSALLKEEKGRQTYLVLTSFSFYDNQLSDSTWRLKEQLGSGYIFSKC